MKNSKLLILCFLPLLFVANFVKNKFKNIERIEILVNGNKFDPEKESLQLKDKIEFLIINVDKEAKYQFSEIAVEWLFKKKVKEGGTKEVRGYRSQFKEYQEAKRKTKVIKQYIGYDLKNWDSEGYKKFSNQPKVIVPYEQFNDLV